jgi:hypothetical protein
LSLSRSKSESAFPISAFIQLMRPLIAARAWIDAQREQLRAAIDADPQIRALRETVSDDHIELTNGRR